MTRPVPTEGATILVVEDEPGMLRAVRRILAARHEVIPAQRATEATERLREHDFDIAIVDVQLPDGDGFEVTREIHRLQPGVDVILMTGSTSRQDQKIFQALEQDVFYFLFKPFDRRVLIALVERCLRLRHLQEENRLHLERLARDQAKAREIQLGLLPSTPLERGGWRVNAHFEPADEVSGDLYAVEPCGETGGLSILVVDVVGHGLPAALYAGMLRSTFDAARRLDPGPSAVYDRLFESLDVFASNRGATLFYGWLQPDGHLRYCNAGHPPALLQRSDSPADLKYLSSTGPKLFPAPVVRALPRTSGEVKLEPGDRLLLYTDGLTEALSPDHREMGLEGVETAVREAPAAKILGHLLARFQNHCDGRPVEDDVTVVLVERVKMSNSSL